MKTTYNTGAKVTTVKKQGKWVATIDFGGVTTVEIASFPTLLKAKVDVAVKRHWSMVIKALADTAREINATARRNRV